MPGINLNAVGNLLNAVKCDTLTFDLSIIGQLTMHFWLSIFFPIKSQTF